MFGISLGDLVLALRLLERVAKLVFPLIGLLRGPLLSTAMFASMVVSLLAIREGGVQPAMSLLFHNSHAVDAMQQELRIVARRDGVVNVLMQAILIKASTAARVRFAIVHNGEVGLTGLGLLRFDITHAIARQGYSVGPLTTNGPLADWDQYLGKLLTGECSAVSIEEASGVDRMRMIDLGASERLSCPVMDIQGRLLGALFVTWPTGVTLPDGAEMQRTAKYIAFIGAQVAAAFIAVGKDVTPVISH